jgi:hypothetical protein
MATKEHKARIVGRSLRLLLGIALTWMTYDVMRSDDAAFNLKVAGVFALMAAFYSAMHFAITRYTPTVNSWLGAIVAVAPAALVYALGGPVGRVAAVAYVGISLVLQAIRSDGGCEVMSIPAIFFRRRTHLVCIAFSPIDWVEERLKNSIGAS